MPALQAQLGRVVREEDWRVLPMLSERVLIGRSRDCDVCLKEDRRVSRHHAELFRQGEEWFVRDLDSSNGTYLNGMKVVRSRLGDDDCVRAGSTDLRFALSVEDSAPRLRWLPLGPDGEDRQVVGVPPEGLSIGRHQSCDLCLAGASGVSRRHAALRPEGENWIIEDLGSQNGTFVNGRRISQRQRLQEGDELRFAGESYRFYTDLDHAESPVGELTAKWKAGEDPTLRFIAVSPHQTIGDASPAQEGYGFLGLRRPRRRRAAQVAGAFAIGVVAAAAWSCVVRGGAPAGRREWVTVLVPTLLGGLAAAVLTALPSLTKRLTVAPYFRLRYRLLRWAARRRLRRARKRLTEWRELQPGTPDALAETLALRLLRGDLRGALEIVESTEAGGPARLANNRGVALARSHLLAEAAAEFGAGVAAEDSNALCQANLGRAHLETGQLAEAVQVLERAVGSASNEPDSRASLGSAYLRAGRLQEAETELLTAVEQDPTSGDAANDLGVVYHLRRNTDRSRRFLRGALRTEPGHPLVHANLGLDHLFRGQSSLALAALSRAHRLSGRSPVVANSLSVAHYLAGSVSEAEATLRQALTAAAVPDEVPYNLGTIRWLRGEHEDAARALERVVKLRPEDAAARLNLGCAHLQLGNLAEAAEHFERAVAAEPDNPAAVTNFGLSLVLRGQGTEALLHLERAVQLAPEQVVIRFNLAYCHHLLGNVEEAVRGYDQLLDRDRRLPEVHVNLGLCHFFLGSTDMAIACLRSALALRRDLHTAPFSLGRLYCEKRDLKSARPLLERAQTDEPVNPDLWRNLGLVYYHSGQNEPAQKALRRAVQLVPDDAADHNNLAVVYSKAGKHDSAIYHFKRALEHSPSDAAVHGNLGVAYYLSGQADLAMAEWQQVSTLSPGLTAGLQGERHVEFDEASMAYTPLDWRARAVYVPPVGMGLRYRALASEGGDRWQIAMTDEDLVQASVLLRRARRYQDALSALLVSPHRSTGAGGIA